MSPPTVASRKLALLQVLDTVVYQHLLVCAHRLALVVWLVRVLCWHWQPLTLLWGIATSLGLAVLVRLALLAVIDVTSFPAINVS